MATKKQTAKPALRWRTSGSADDLDPAELIAQEILIGRRDVLPSVERIMTAGLSSAGTLRAISLFRDALTTPGDVNRDPRVAIADAEATASVTPAE